MIRPSLRNPGSLAYFSFLKWRSLALLVALLLGSISSHAQVAGATLSGEVTDKTGATIPGATVIIHNVDTGQERVVRSNGGGFYSAPNLNPGNYEVNTSAPGFSALLQKGLALTVGSEITFNPSLVVGGVTQSVVVMDLPSSVNVSSSTLSATVDGTTVRELPLNGRDWTSLATLEPGVVSVPNQATTGFSANKGNRGFGNQLSDGGHRANENTYRVNGMVINDYTNAAPGGATGVNLGVDAIDQFSVLTANYTSEYGRTSGAVIDAVTKTGTNKIHGSAYVFDRDSIFDAKNAFDSATARIPPFRRVQFGGAVGFPLKKDKTFVFVDYEGIRQSQSQSGTNKVPDAAARAAAVPAIRPYLALWPVAPGGSPDTPATPGALIGIQTYTTSIPTKASENYITARLDQRFNAKDSLDGTFFFDSGPQTQADPLGNTVHQVFSRRQLYSVEETHIFTPSIVNTFRGGVSRIIGLINAPVSADAVATDPTLAIAPGAVAPPQIPVSGLTTAYGLNGFNKFNHAWTSIQLYDDAFITRGTHSFKLGFAFERMRYNIIEKLSPNGRMSTYTLAAFLANAPKQLNAVAPGGSHEVGLRESIFAGYFQDDWLATKRLNVNLGLRYEAATRPKNSNTIPGYTVNGYTVAAAGFQQITTLSNCLPKTTACGPVGTDSPIATNPTKFDFEPRLGLSYDPFGNGKTAIRAAAGIFDVLPLPYEFGLNTAATAPFQIIGADPTATLGTGLIDQNVNFNPQAVRNRYIQQDPKRAAVYNYSVNVQRDLGKGFTGIAGYVGSHSTHLSVAADDINLVPSTFVSGVGIVVPYNGARVDSNWGGGAGIRPVIFDGTSSYSALQAQLKKAASHGVQGQASYTYSHCNDRSSAPVTGDTYLNSIAVPLLTQKAARIGPCDFDIRQVLTVNTIWSIPAPESQNSIVQGVTHGWQLGGIVLAESGAPFSVTFGGGNDPLNTGFNGDFSMDLADLLPNCNPIHGGRAYLNTNCFTPPTAPSSLALASAANPLGCAPGFSPTVYYKNYQGPAAPAGRQFCSNVVGNTTRNQFTGPRLTNVDMSLYKNTKITSISEAFNVQFRAEFFNIFNHPSYLSPGFLNTFGQNNSVYDVDGSSLPTALNQTATNSRQIQLGLKMNF